MRSFSEWYLNHNVSTLISPFPAFPEGKTVKEQVFLEKDLSLPTFFRESRPKNFSFALWAAGLRPRCAGNRCAFAVYAAIKKPMQKACGW